MISELRIIQLRLTVPLITGELQLGVATLIPAFSEGRMPAAGYVTSNISIRTVGEMVGMVVANRTGGDLRQNLRAAVDVFPAQGAVHVFHDGLSAGIDIESRG